MIETDLGFVVAWIEQEPGRRLEAMRSLWTESEAPVERQARLILTAGAAARIPVSPTMSPMRPT